MCSEQNCIGKTGDGTVILRQLLIQIRVAINDLEKGVENNAVFPNKKMQ